MPVCTYVHTYNRIWTLFHWTRQQKLLKTVSIWTRAIRCFVKDSPKVSANPHFSNLFAFLLLKKCKWKLHENVYLELANWKLDRADPIKDCKFITVRIQEANANTYCEVQRQRCKILQRLVHIYPWKFFHVIKQLHRRCWPSSMQRAFVGLAP
jgi:hypothetical protein